MRRFLFSLAIFLLAVSPAFAAKTLTAFTAQQIAEKQIPPEAIHKLILIRGDRSATSLMPDTWHFVFYDEMASQNGRLMTVTGSAVSGIREGYFDLGHMRMAAYKMDEIMAPEKLKVDSDKALDILTRTNLLKNYSLSSVVYELSRNPDLREPIWRLQVYVDDGHGKEKNIGFARISAEDGKILEMRFKPFVPKP